ncbi:MAG: hypothetical protein ACTSWC_06795 [Promethearchaeota archaeon]
MQDYCRNILDLLGKQELHNPKIIFVPIYSNRITTYGTFYSSVIR